MSGYTAESVSEVSSGGYVYNLARINLSYVKSKLAQVNRTAYNEFIINGGYIVVDSCMITIKIDGYGNRTNSGSMDDYGNFSGSVYTDYNGIANAAPWGNPSSLQSYFNKTINYFTELKTKQIVYVRYQQADGSYGNYNAVINKDYVYGETVSWSRSATTCYNSASISYTATKAKTSYVSVTRKQYTQNVYVKYQDANGNYSSSWTLVKSSNQYYGSSFSWSYSGNACYNPASVSSYTVKGSNNKYIYISRKTYSVNVRAGTGISSVSGTGTYYYGATCTVNASVKTGYTFHFYAIWDYAPELTCSDRYFTLYEAQNGLIKEEELLRTAESIDREDGTTDIIVKNYSANTFTSLSGTSVITITYTTTDSKGNTIEKQVKVTIVDTGATEEGEMDFDGWKNYVRFISSDYYLIGVESGGLERTSKWRSDENYFNVLRAALENVKGEDGEWSHVWNNYEFSEEEIKELKN